MVEVAAVAAVVEAAVVEEEEALVVDTAERSIVPQVALALHAV